jgi:DNA-binding SARP family transcriptional activator
MAMTDETGAGVGTGRAEMGEAWGRIDLLSGEIRTNEPGTKLTRLERAVLVYLAVKRGGSREEIADTLFGHLDLESAHNTLKVAICRARRKCGLPPIVNWSDGRYALTECPLDELRATESAVRLTRQARRRLCAGEMARFEAYAQRLKRRVKDPWACEPWFEPIEWRLGHLNREVCTVLATDALLAGDPARALGLAIEYEDGESLDEEPREIAIRAYHALGNRGAALAEFLRYERALERELGIKPGENLRNLAFKGIAQ